MCNFCMKIKSDKQLAERFWFIAEKAFKVGCLTVPAQGGSQAETNQNIAYSF